eukprot:15445576-Alexandrium_andersonii.AAC.6
MLPCCKCPVGLVSGCAAPRWAMMIQINTFTGACPRSRKSPNHRCPHGRAWLPTPTLERAASQWVGLGQVATSLRAAAAQDAKHASMGGAIAGGASSDDSSSANAKARI